MQNPHMDIPQIGCVMALTALTDNYTFRVWSKTHRQLGNERAICVDELSEKAGCYKIITLNAGDTVLFHGALIHSGTGGHGLALHSYGMPIYGTTKLYNADGATASFPAKFVNQDVLDSTFKEDEELNECDYETEVAAAEAGVEGQHDGSPVAAAADTGVDESTLTHLKGVNRNYPFVYMAFEDVEVSWARASLI